VRALACVAAAALAALAAGCDVGSDGGGGSGGSTFTRPELPKVEQPKPSDPSRAVARECDRVAAPWGSDSASGSPADPVRSPGRLVSALAAGATGCLREGTYTERIVLITAPKVTVRSAPGERATWRGRIVVAGDGDRLAGLVLDGTAGTLCDEGRCGIEPSPTINAADVTIAGNDITNRGGICVHPVERDGRNPDRFRIERNRIHDCGRRPPTEKDHGVYVADGTYGVIRDNVIYHNADRGIQLFPHAQLTRIEHNTVDGNGTGIIFSETSSNNDATGNVFSNSVRRFNAESFDLTGAGNRFVDNCVVPGHEDPDYNQNGGVQLPDIVEVTGNVGEANDPYRDREAGDFRLKPGTRCAGKGAPADVARHDGVDE
jgi:parallel beta helix pectate lyase-like protein